MSLLSENQKKVYKMLLLFKMSTIGRIAQSTGLHRQSAKIVIDTLIKKGLVRVEKKNNRYNYFPISLNKVINDELTKLKIIENELLSLNKSYQETKNTQIMNILKGKYGLRAILLDEIIKGDKISAFNYSKRIGQFWDEYEENDKRRVRQNIPLKIITSQKLPYIPLSEIKKTQKSGKTDAFVYKDKLSLLYNGYDLIILTIKINEVTKLFKDIFKDEWGRIE